MLIKIYFFLGTKYFLRGVKGRKAKKIPNSSGQYSSGEGRRAPNGTWKDSGPLSLDNENTPQTLPTAWTGGHVFVKVRLRVLSAMTSKVYIYSVRCCPALGLNSIQSFKCLDIKYI